MPKRVIPTPYPEDSIVISPAAMGAAIRAIRTSHKMTLEEAAIHLGMAKQTLQDIELGKGNPSFERVLRVALGFGLTLFAVRQDDFVAIQSFLRKAPAARQ